MIHLQFCSLPHDQTRNDRKQQCWRLTRVLMFDVYHGTAPKYLTDLCSRCNDHRLRSSTRGDFVVGRTRTRLADSSFTVAGPAAWNSLRACIWSINSYDSFCRQLKTYTDFTSLSPLSVAAQRSAGKLMAIHAYRIRFTLYPLWSASFRNSKSTAGAGRLLLRLMRVNGHCIINNRTSKSTRRSDQLSNRFMTCADELDTCRCGHFGVRIRLRPHVCVTVRVRSWTLRLFAPFRERANSLRIRPRPPTRLCIHTSLRLRAGIFRHMPN